MTRVMEFSASPLAAEDLMFRSMQCVERVGEVSRFEIVALSPHPDIDPAKILGHPLTVKLELPGNALRYFDSYVVEFGLTGTEGRFYRYSIIGASWTWMLSRTTDCRIFQGKTVPEIVKDIFSKYGVAKFDDKLTGQYRTWEYCVQYRESDLNFVYRLLETEGIYTYFRHENGKHTLVLADSPSAHLPFAGFETIPYIAHDQAARIDSEYFTDWSFNNSVQPGRYTLADFDFKKPATRLQSKTTSPRGHAQSEYEYFDYPGAYSEFSHGDNYSRIRFDELNAQHGRNGGSGNIRALGTGYLFTLSGHPRQDQNIEYLVLSTSIRMSDSGAESEASGGPTYHVSCAAIPSKEHFRPRRVTPKPHVQGPQTATVVGPAGEEIYVDEYGRIKVQFHWDRYGERDENSSCWIRVANPWAGKNYGMVSHPRIGQEVVVDFLEGDPDQPLVTTRVYNAGQMPPYSLPANKTQTGILSRSTEGAASHANELRFEDKKGQEHVLLHAEKDQMIEVENDETHWVGHDRKKTIDNDETTRVQRHRTETVGGNETITVHQNRTETVNQNETLTIHQNRTETVDGNETHNIHQNRSHRVDQNASLSVGQSRTTDVGQDDKLSVSGSQTLHVSGTKTETVNMAAIETVMLAKMVNVMGAYSENVGLARNTIVGMSDTEFVGRSKSANVKEEFTLTVGKKFTVQCGATILVLNADGKIALTGKEINITAQGGDVTINGEKVWINPVDGKAAAQPAGGGEAQATAQAGQAAPGSGIAPTAASGLGGVSQLLAGSQKLMSLASAAGLTKNLGPAANLISGLGSFGGLTSSDVGGAPADAAGGDAATPPLAMGGCWGGGDAGASGGLGGLSSLGGLVDSGSGGLDGLLGGAQKLASLSPTLTGLLKQFQGEQGGSVQLGQAGKGSYTGVTPSGSPAIYLDPAEHATPASATGALSRELGSATSATPLDTTSAEAFAASSLSRDGAGVLTGIQAQREILAKGGPDIMPCKSNAAACNQLYDHVQQGVIDSNTAQTQIGQMLGNHQAAHAAPGLSQAAFYRQSFSGAPSAA